jgi:hypothetical protein
VLKAVQGAKDPLAFLYKEIQFGLRAAVGTRTLDELLEDKGAVDAVVFDHVRPTALRLKELEALERVTEKIGTISVYGGLDGVLNELVRIKR